MGMSIEKFKQGQNRFEGNIEEYEGRTTNFLEMKIKSLRGKDEKYCYLIKNSNNTLNISKGT